MMKYILKLVLTALFVYLLAHWLPFVKIYKASSVLFFVFLLSIFNASLKPILVVLTIPLTILSLGLFLLVINGIVILVADYFIQGIVIGSGMFDAIILSVLLSLFNYLIEKILDKK